MSDENPDFPLLTNAEAAQVAASLTSAVCSLMSDCKGMSENYALHLSRMVFAEQYHFLRKKRWEEETDKFLMPRKMDLS